MHFSFANGIFLVLPWLDRDPKILPAHRRPVLYLVLVLMADLIVLTVYGKLPPTGTNAWVGFFAAVAFILLFVVFQSLLKLMLRKGDHYERIKKYLQ